MRIGYACKCVAVPGTNLRTCTAAKASEELLNELIAHNLKILDKMIDYNIKNDIRMLRVSSDIIPFGSSPVNILDWTDLFAEELEQLGQKALKADIRLSMHPGQYTVLNSPDEEVVARAVKDLEYHCAFLDGMGMPAASKIILHIGGVYGDKEQAVERFCENYQQLSEAVKKRLIIENDERNYNIEEVLYIGERMQIPVVFDNLHYALNQPSKDCSETEWIALCAKTWQEADGDQKMHYSQQAAGKRPGAHSETIDAAEFKAFVGRLPSQQVDIMLEVKDKNRSAIKCINYLGMHHEIKYLEEEWARYKYDVLSHSQQIYNEIRQLLKDKKAYPAEEFYRLIDRSVRIPGDSGSQLNAADHVWGYFKDIAAERDKKMYLRKRAEFKQGETSEAALRKFLYRMACRYQENYLLNSYYFEE